MKLADMHCDTPYELYKKREKLNDNSLHISLRRAACFDKYLQVAAVWSDKRLDDDACYRQFFSAADYFRAQAGEALSVCPYGDNKVSFILAAEDARLLGGRLERLGALHEAGVRLLTLTWAGVSCIGGAWDTDCGLTDFGRAVTEECFRLGIIPDVSHASDKSTEDVLSIAKSAGKPVCATHSNSRSVCRHMRNLSDEAFRRICDIGGIVGISLCPAHLSLHSCDISDILSHVRHYINIGGADCIGFGCDFDGIDALPKGISGLDSMAEVYCRLSDSFGSSVADKLFYSNVYNFLHNNTVGENAREV